MSTPTPDRRYLELLSEKFPTIQAAYTEVINLKAILNLPKGTEHFMSDIHGEYEAFLHILNNCSGVVRERVRATFAGELTPREQDDLCTLIYYPREKLIRLKGEGVPNPSWYYQTLFRLVRLARYLSGFYTRSKVRKAMPEAYAYIIDELLRASSVGETSRHEYHVRIIESIIEEGAADDFIESLSALIKRLAVDRLHIVGDIFDRGAKGDRILDRLALYPRLDIQWGNHDMAWLGAACGSEVCIATVVRTCVRYGTLNILESGYGVPLRRLYRFAERTYGQVGARPVGGDQVHGAFGGAGKNAISRAERAIDVILFKLEGQLIMRHPELRMEGRLLLDKMDLAAGTVVVDGVTWPLSSVDFPTLDPADPYALSEEERAIMDDLVESFAESDRLHRHAAFMYDHGSTYLVHNGNLLFHGCVPLEEDGSLRVVETPEGPLAGKAYLDFCERIARRAWRTGDQEALDWMWYLWCGWSSPFAGRVVKTFERAFIPDKTSWNEPQDAYFRLNEDPAACRHVLAEFGLEGEHCHIINGHKPVRAIKGESPLKAGGIVIVIDGGFCEAYHNTTGIAGYTLISDPHGLRLKAHRPFGSIEDALDLNADIVSETDRFEHAKAQLRVADTDDGVKIRRQIADLEALLEAYRSGEMAERRR
ncbi:MAG: fructose-1,6-bisphosphatase [Olsenella sp.]|nr:fructose-1,6-bisphosphatase [Olsenella sp.]